MPVSPSNESGEFLPYVVVRWVIPTDYGTVEVDEVDECGPNTLTSVGYLVRENQNMVVIAGAGQQDAQGALSFLETKAIPRKSIQSIQRLEIKRSPPSPPHINRLRGLN